MHSSWYTVLTQFFSDEVGSVQTWLFVEMVQPLLYRLNMMSLSDLAYDGTFCFVAGALQIIIVYLIVRPLESLWPLEDWPDRRAVRVDIIYTLISRLGLIGLIFFFTLQPLFDALQGWLQLHGIFNVNLEQLTPGAFAHPLFGFLVYAVVLDFAGYWYHRWQHQIKWWWELHAVHHTQRQLSLWSDDRNHLLDELLLQSYFATLALLIGVEPGQFVILTLLSGALQSLQHANVWIRFGWLGERLLVSPRFHRLHHAIGYGHDLNHRNRARVHGCNFGILFPWWDILFGSADFDTPVQPTGVRGEIEGEDYGHGFWDQQWVGILRAARQVLK